MNAENVSKPADSFSFARVLLFAVPLGLAVGAYAYYQQQEANKIVAPQADFLLTVKRNLETPTQLSAGLNDANGDLVADAPTEAAEFIDPDTLVFSLLGADVEKEKERWGDFITHLEKVTGKKVEAVIQEGSALAQAKEGRAGTLHVVTMNTGGVVVSVNEGGIVPLCVMADADGKFGYEMEIIVPAKSALKTPADLKGKPFSFASMYSHSGFKAPLLTLWKEFNLQPDRDYLPKFDGGQEQIIKYVAEGKIEAAAVAGDLLRRVSDRGEFPKDAIRSIYKSKTFPPACFGYAHQLKPELAEKIKTAFLEFPWSGTSLEKAYASAQQSKFVPISYQEQWAEVREMENFLATLLKERGAK